MVSFTLEPVLQPRGKVDSETVWHAPPEFNAFAASFVVGFSANAYARVTDHFSFNSIVAGVFIQVPGSWGMRGLLALAYGVGTLISPISPHIHTLVADPADAGVR